MDKFVRRFPSYQDGELMIARGLGVAWQADMKSTTTYGDDYLAKVDAYDGSPVATAVNAGRCKMLKIEFPECGFDVLDCGAGSGAFVRAARDAGFTARGFDVIPAANERLCAQGLYDDSMHRYDVVTAWDVLEHLECPGAWLDGIPQGRWLFLSIPIFKSLDLIRQSKHYRPGEHLMYWASADGFVEWMSLYGFRWLGTSTHEVLAGRESILAFAFRRDLLATRADLLPCACGGDVYLDHFDPIRRPVEWFMRCIRCGEFSTPGATPEAAERLWKESA